MLAQLCQTRGLPEIVGDGQEQEKEPQEGSLRALRAR